uniref:Uncharacterized protein n=1 Tax=Florenciella sp. virus SA2 TaxID=3240092 RepID=A0AB39JDB1_9VIRU
MNIDRSTVLSFILTILIILLISILINYFLNCTIKEGLKSFGEADTSFNGPLPYETTMNQIKYPNPNDTPIYSLADPVYNPIVFNKTTNEDQYSDNSIMTDLKYFNNTSNLLIENYYNDNRPNNITKYIQDVTADSNNPEWDKYISYADMKKDISFDSVETNETVYEINFNKYDQSVSSQINDKYLYDNGNNVDISYVYLYTYAEDDDPTDPKSGKYLYNKQLIIDGNVEQNEYNDITKNIYYDNSQVIFNYDIPVFTNNDDTDINYDGVYAELIKCYPGDVNCSISSMKDKGKYSSQFFESNYDASYQDTISEDFKYFNSATNMLMGDALYNKSISTVPPPTATSTAETPAQ